MSGASIVFYLLAFLTVISAAGVVLSRSLIYSAFSLLFTFGGVAGLYLMLGADFLAASQLLIYIGGILMLLLFGVMLTHKLYDLDLKTEVTQFWTGFIIASGLFVVLAWPTLLPLGSTESAVVFTRLVALVFFGSILAHKLLIDTGRAIAATVVVAVALGVLGSFGGRGVIFGTEWALGDGRAPAPTTAEIGRLFMGSWILPFEVASVLLLVALIGAALIVRRKKEA